MISIKKVRKAITHTITLMYLRKWIAKEIKEFKQYIKHMNLPRFDKVVLNTGSVPDKSVLICEPYFGHSECFTAWTKYFQDLGYNVDIITRYEHFYDNPFCRTKKPPRMFYGSLSMLKKWLKNENISKYDYVFFATHVRFDTFPNKLLLDYLGFTPNAKYGCLFIDHMPNIFFKEFNEVNLVRQNRIFALSDIPEMPQLNSHYFYNVPRHNKNHKTRFIVVKAMDKNAKNFELIVNAARDLVKQGKKFSIRITGGKKLKVPDDLQKYIVLLGRLPYSKMYDELENADFILAAINPFAKGHQKYMKTFTGSLMYSYGFTKPLIITEKFGKSYGLTDSNSILHADNDIVDAMKFAIKMNIVEYKKIQSELKKTSDKVYKKSLTNLKAAIKKTSV